MSNKQEALFRRRRERTRFKLRQAAKGRARLSVHRIVAAHLRPGDRRHRRAYAGGGLDARRGTARRAEDRRRQGERPSAVGKLIAERAKAAGRRARRVRSRRLSCIMAGSRPWPTPPARAGWSSERTRDGTHAGSNGAGATAATASSATATRASSPKSWSTSTASPRS